MQIDKKLFTIYSVIKSDCDTVYYKGWANECLVSYIVHTSLKETNISEKEDISLMRSFDI